MKSGVKGGLRYFSQGLIFGAGYGGGGAADTAMQKPQFDLAKVVALLSVGVGSVVSIGLFIALGLLLDNHIGTTPLFTLIGLFAGGAGVFYTIYRHMITALSSRDSTHRKQEDGSESSEDTGRE